MAVRQVLPSGTGTAKFRDVLVLLPFFAARPEKLGDRFGQGLDDSPDRIQEHRHAATVRLEQDAAKSRLCPGLRP
ncbi:MULTISPECIES: hypothetical protein [unclassified Pseudarthrobacter]|uniref:hypothetical protein n=1 Tax=unclassified Pseudarthrobacter TaxID=2647000 RepID=UPI00362FB264